MIGIYRWGHTLTLRLRHMKQPERVRLCLTWSTAVAVPAADFRRAFCDLPGLNIIGSGNPVKYPSCWYEPGIVAGIICIGVPWIRGSSISSGDVVGIIPAPDIDDRKWW